MRERFVKVDGRQIYAVEAGHPDGAPVIVHHGTPGAPLFWQEWVADAEARGIRLIGFARPGYAGSSRLEGRSVADVATDCAAVADALAVDRFATWGISGGGLHALACAALLDGRVTRVATLGTVAPWDAPNLAVLDGMREDNVAEFAAAREGSSVLRQLLEPTATAMAGLERGILLEQLDGFLDPCDAEVARDGFGEVLVDGIRLGLRNGVDGWVDDDLALVRPWGFDLSDVTCPVGVWHGAQDTMVPPAHGRWLAATVKAERVEILQADGHLAVLAHRAHRMHAWLVGGAEAAHGGQGIARGRRTAGRGVGRGHRHLQPGPAPRHLQRTGRRAVLRAAFHLQCLGPGCFLRWRPRYPPCRQTAAPTP